MTRLLPFFLVVTVVGFSGCGDAVPSGNSNANNSNQNNNNEATNTNNPPPNVKSSFGSVDEAIGVLITSAQTSDAAQRQAAASWLGKQGEPAVTELAKVMNENEDLRVQVAATLAIGQAGPPAFDTLVKATDHPQNMVRVNAVKGLAAIKPPTKETVDTLLRLLKHQDQRVVHAAITGLGALGPKAERAADPLVAILNSQADDALRNAAKKALKSVNPRHTFQD